ncbi:oligopeptide transporter ATP-binding component [Aeromonas rivipollensis]|nr:oligopeptide transporter ATP-binding component [Aeromonas rivipollensis]MCE9957329.1 oligopeptide transporter ATP-binding component [Aeromonas rivipollensis]
MGGAICGQQPSMLLTPFGDGRTRACHWVSDAMIKGVN